jgi:type I restriction enzyme S subunit
VKARTARVGELAQQVRGVTYSADQAVAARVPGFIPILRANNITERGPSFDDLIFVPESVVGAQQRLRANDVLIATSSGSISVVGKAARITEDFDGGFGAFCKVLRPSDKVDSSYFAHFFKTRDYRQRVSALAAGASINNLRNEHLDGFEIPLPPLPEQRRIADVLDRAETLRAQRRQALARLDALEEAIFRDMFGDPVTNPKGWPRKPMGAIGRVVTGNTPSRANAAYFGGSLEWIKSDNLNTPEDHATQATEYLSEAGRVVARVVPAGSILVTCIAGSPDCIGNAAMVSREVAFNQQINALVPAEGCLDFWYAQLRVGKHLIQAASTDGMKGMVSKSRFERIELIAPPQALQRVFAGRRDAIARLKSIQASALAELDALFASLQHRAFRGEL